MGTGKTRVGRLLAKQMKMPFVDLDQMIEERQGIDISSLFQRYGQSFFRELEHQYCQELSKSSGQIIATGGGTLVSLANRKLFAQDSIFCLEAPFEVIRERLSRSQKRPLAANARELWIERRAEYRKFLHRISSWTHSVEWMVERIQVLYQLEQQLGLEGQADDSISIAPGNLNRLSDFLTYVNPHPGSQVVVITHPSLQALYGSLLDSYPVLLVPEGEASKSLEQASQLYEALSQMQIGRRDLLVAFGGGVIGDLVGFVAATYCRGMPYVQVPTTLLAMVDSSVGAKTGIDFLGRKNQIGAFKEPRGVFMDTDCLKSLPRRELACGFAEVVKHAMIGDTELFEYLEAGGRDFEWIIRRSIRVKSQIVQEDPEEEYTRMVLNLGHTFGHAIEKLSAFEVQHGEAVAIGLVMAARFSRQQGYCSQELPERVVRLLQQFNLPTELPSNVSEKEVWAEIAYDKKRQGHRVHLILPYALGDVRICSLAIADFSLLPKS